MKDNETPISMTEHLSALLDDEAGSFEERRVLDELKSDSQMSKKLETYALIGETMRTGVAQQSVLPTANSFLNSIHEKISIEEQFDKIIINDDVSVNQVTQTNQSVHASNTSKLKPIGGFALAASVGALAFMSLQNAGFLNKPSSTVPTNTGNSESPIAIADASTTKEVIANDDAKIDSLLDAELASNNDQYMDADAETRSMLKRYVDSHMQYSTSSTFVPSVRVIAYTDNQ